MPNPEECKKILYQKPIPKYMQDWFNITAPCRILNLLSPQDITYLNQVATSVKLSGNPSKKKELITQLMKQRGFKKLDCGTNRIVYKFMENQTFLIKVAFDRVAIQDNLREFKNQEYLKPFCAKCFEVTPCGTVGMFERVKAVSTREQFLEIADRVFDIIVNCFIGKFILADFGTKYYKNWGVRVGSFPVILDYPYLYETDEAKLYCNNYDPNSSTGYCGGEIDYDDGFNVLLCKKCGKTFLASELGKNKNKPGGLLIERKETCNMEVTIIINGEENVIKDKKETSTYQKNKLSRKEYTMKKRMKGFSVEIELGEPDPEDIPIEEEAVEPKVMTEKESMIESVCNNMQIEIIEPKKSDPPRDYGKGVEFEDISETDNDVIYKDPEGINLQSTLATALMSINAVDEKEDYDINIRYDVYGNMVTVDDPDDPTIDHLSDVSPKDPNAIFEDGDEDNEEEDTDDEYDNDTDDYTEEEILNEF